LEKRLKKPPDGLGKHSWPSCGGDQKKCQFAEETGRKLPPGRACRAEPPATLPFAPKLLAYNTATKWNALLTGLSVVS